MQIIDVNEHHNRCSETSLFPGIMKNSITSDILCMEVHSVGARMQRMTDKHRFRSSLVSILFIDCVPQNILFKIVHDSSRQRKCSLAEFSHVNFETSEIDV